MDLPDCPPGAEGYEDSVVEVPKKPSSEDLPCTKAEQEFQEHLNSLKIKVEDGEFRCMVERRGRDVSGKWIYLCYPCAAVCSGESILQTHISGKKHKTKLSLKNMWPVSIFEQHPYILTEKGIVKEKAEATEKVLKKMAEEVKYHNEDSELDQKYNKYRGIRCHIQDSIDQVKAPLIGLEYLVEHPPEEAHYEPSYVCTLCTKHGHPRTIINHLTCFWHRYHYLTLHFPKAGALLAPYRGQAQYREGVGLITNRLMQRIEDKFGRLQPVNIDKEEYEKERVSRTSSGVFSPSTSTRRSTRRNGVRLITNRLMQRIGDKFGRLQPVKHRQGRVREGTIKEWPTQYREGVGLITNRLMQRIEDKFGRLQPVNIDKEEYEKERLVMCIKEWSTQYREGVGLITNRLMQRIEDKFGRVQPVNIDKEEYEKERLVMCIKEWSTQYREGVGLITNRLMQRIEDKFGRLQPVNIDKEEYEKERDRIHQWIYKGYHFAEKEGATFEEVVDVGLIESLHKSSEKLKDKKEPSPPVVQAPAKPLFNSHTRPRHERRISVDALSDISDEPEHRRPLIDDRYRGRPGERRYEPYRKLRYEKGKPTSEKNLEKIKPPNYEYKQKLASEQKQAAEEAAKKTLAYHEKNPEKHPLYPEEWKKFWNRRYKEIQAEGKDPSKHDFKPEWIKYWTVRMKQLHEDELRCIVTEIYRKMCLPLPDAEPAAKPPDAAHRSERSAEPRRRSPDPRERRRTPERRRSPDPRRRSPEHRRRSPPDMRRRSPPDMRRRSPPDMRRRSPRHRTPERGRRTPDRRIPPERWRPMNDRFHRDFRSPGHHKSMDRRPSPPRHSRPRSRSPIPRARSPIRTHIQMDSLRRSHSPLSRRDDSAALRNRSPARAAPEVAPSLQTVLISDEELKPDDNNLSPWDSDNDGSFGSLPDARMSCAGSEKSRQSRPPREYSRPAEPSDLGPPENIVATLRLLVALEDYLGSLGPKIVDLLTEALRMEKEKANSSEELLVRDSAVVLMETAKEKLKGAMQAGLVPAAAAPAVRSAVVRAAATLHAADQRSQASQSAIAAAPVTVGARKRTRTRPRTRRRPRRGPLTDQKTAKGKPAPMPVAGVGEVDRAQIAQQMAEALIAQGKTDVSSEELAQLVDAVVGMAEAKKREAETKKKLEAKPAPPKPKPLPAAVSGTASALQMLQSAYDENDKKTEKDDKVYTPDAMDGLSDSDLETLLKNFNELSAEEQHSLIAYLKKLEAREPQRVERLRQYVSAAAEPEPAREPDTKPVTIESDDDDYTVEEVFQSATQKVKEDQMRQEMEIVKKSLEETTKESTPTPEVPKPAPKVDLSIHMSSATDLLALVQASIQSTAAAPAPAAAADVVASLTQPRSFGDLPEASMASNDSARSHSTPTNVQPFDQNTNTSDGFNDNEQSWNSRPNSNMSQEMPPANPGAPYGMDNRGPYGQDSQGSFNQQPRGPMGFNQDNRGFNQDNRGFNQDNRGPFGQDNRGPFGQDSRGGFNTDNRPPFNQGNRGPFNQDNQGSFNQDNQVSFNQDNQVPFNQDNQVPFNQDNQGLYNQDSQGTFNQDNQVPYNQDNRGNFNSDNRGNFNSDNRGNFNHVRPPLLDSRGVLLSDNRNMQGNMGFPNNNNWGSDNRGGYNQDNRPSGPRSFDNQYSGNGNNFMNGGGMQGNSMQHQRGGYEPQKNFRGRGRGQYGGNMRGRGRGGYY
ncbi:uncharacterized protein LOC135078792 [Ostrinia nubilalis]|uniref:uncharacterized protein LOC135078792 n=1 Tax=Ostrinia nubilalis TaxID=29057 RepID=UPI0030826935